MQSPTSCPPCTAVHPLDDRPTADHSPAACQEAVAGLPVSGGVGAEPPPCGPQAASAVTSLDHQETSESDCIRSFLNEKPTPIQGSTTDGSIANNKLWTTAAERFRHSGWRVTRERVFAALQRTGQSSSRVSSFCSCGAGGYVQRRQDKSGMWEYRIRHQCCHDRLCTPCANGRAWKLQLSVRSILPKSGVSFVTLTLAGKDQGLSEKIDRLYKHFKALRNHPTWSENVTGGVAFLEIKWSDKAQRWHPHLHVLCVAKYIPQDQLSAAWLTISKDSYIVDIQRVTSADKATAYVTKYASKPLNTSFANTPALLDEAVVAIKGRRLAMAFGTWYGKALNLDEDELLDEGDEGQADWENYFPLETLIEQCNSGDTDSLAILRQCGGETSWRVMLDSS